MKRFPGLPLKRARLYSHTLSLSIVIAMSQASQHIHGAKATRPHAGHKP